VHDPVEEYKRRLAERRARSAALYRRHIRFGNARLGVALAAALVAWLAFRGNALTAWWLAPLALGFATLVFLHDGVLRARVKCERSVKFFERGLGRIEDRWVGQGSAGEKFADPSHAYAQELDLFGKGSLFEYLSIARTEAGENTLADWLKAPAEPEEIRARQRAVSELQNRVDLREAMAVLAEDVRARVHAGALAKWGAEPILLDSGAARIWAAALAVGMIAAAAAAFAYGIPEIFLFAAAVVAGFAVRYRKRVVQVAGRVDEAARDLELLAAVLKLVERESFRSPKLVEVTRMLEVEGRPASWQIARLRRFVELLDQRDHVAVRAIGPLVLWTTQLAFAVEAWRKRSGPAIARWLEAVGEIEALNSLAGYSYEHPEDPFPVLREEGVWFDGEGMRHPLLAAGRAVANDVRLGGGLRLLIVSGSNMSGKSTLLRTVGVNVVLALAGAPVRARRLCLTPVAVGASIQVRDSLLEGQSRFYAQIVRLRRIVDLSLGPLPVLFLLDELLHGTHSHDRRIGAEAILRGLVERGAVGLITTHDLALAEIAEALGERAANVHFEDRMEAGVMKFDYRLRPGKVQKSNALELMRSIGLEV
jgi:hypothetical protein